MHRDAAFAIASVLGILTAAIGLLPGDPVLRALFAAPLVFFLPGEALLRALRFYPPAPGRQVLASGMSMALCVLGGLLLNTVGWLQPAGWFAWLSAVTAIGALVALRRGAADLTVHWPRASIRPRHAALVAASVAVLTLTVLNSVRNSENFVPFAYTDFWMVPTHVDSTAYTIGIHNAEQRPEVFTLRVMVDGEIVGTWRDISVLKGQTVTQTVTLPKGRRAEAWLLRKGPNRTVEAFRKVSAELPQSIKLIAERD